MSSAANTAYKKDETIKRRDFERGMIVMKKTGILNVRLMAGLTELRHRDSIAILDVGMPIPKGSEVVDLALVKGIPSFLDTVKAVLNEIVVEKCGIFSLMPEYNPEMYGILNGMMPAQEKTLLTQEEFTEEMIKAKVIVRTADFGSCCNIILYSASGRDNYVEKFDVSF